MSVLPVSDHVSIQFKEAFDSIPYPVILTTTFDQDQTPKILYINHRFETLTGYSAHELIGESPNKFQGDESNYSHLSKMRETLLQGNTFTCTTTNYTKTNTPYTIDLTITPIKDRLGEIIHYLGTLQETHHTLHNLPKQIGLKGLCDSKEHIAIFDTKGQFLFINDAYAHRYGYTNDELICTPSSILKSGKHTDAFYKKLWSRLNLGVSVKEIFINKTKSGELIYEEQHISPIKENNTIIGYITIGRNIEHLLSKQSEWQKQAHFDHLTEIFNRHGIQKQLTLAYKEYLITHQDYVVVMVDIDHFKRINDTHGHSCGDKVLKQFADLLRVSIRKDDHVGRWGGEEFIILLKTSIVNAQQICENIRKNITRIPFHDQTFTLSASFGISTFDGTGIDMIIDNADRALYESKRNGRNQITTIDALLCPWRCDTDSTLMK